MNIVSLAPYAIIITDNSGIILEFNPAAEQMFEFTKTELIGKNIVDTIIPSQYRNAHRSGIENYNKRKQLSLLIKSIELWGLKKSGDIFPLEMTLASSQYEGKDCLTSFILDVSSTKESLEALFKTYQKLEFENKIWRAIDQAGQESYRAKDEAGMLKQILEICCQAIGWNLAQFYLRKTINGEHKLVHSISWSPELFKFNNFVQLSKKISFSVGEGLPGAVWKKKSPRWIEDVSAIKSFPRVRAATLDRITSALGLPIYVNEELYGVIELFSIERRTEDISIIRGASILGSYFSKVFEHNYQRLKENELLERLNLAAKLSIMGELAGGIAHEIKNPMTIIVGYASKIKKDMEKENFNKDSTKNTVEKILSTTDRVLKIVDGLKKLSRDDSEDPFTMISVKQVLDDAITLCEPKIKKHSVFLKINPYNEQLQLESHSIQLSQVIMNLVNNSIDAIEKMQDRWIEIDIFNTDETLEIRVTDSGGGIANDIAEKILQPFFTTKAPGVGTGLGLSLAKGIIELHHGKFDLDRQCKNTRFYFQIPLKQPKEKAS
jgi:PAS domain S-box-containing protein